MREPVKFYWKGNHHSYYGIFLIAFGLFNWYMGIDNGDLEQLLPLWQSFTGAGILMVLDDIWEHKISGDTPLRILYEKVVIPWLKKS
jgi:hypothetical protein